MTKTVTANEINGPMEMLLNVVSKITDGRLCLVWKFIDGEVLKPEQIAENLEMLAKKIREPKFQDELADQI